MIGELLGVIGGIIIVIAWILETCEAIKRHKSIMDLRFTFAFFVAAIFLTFYSWVKQDLVFFWINIALILILLVEVFVSVKFRKVNKKQL